LADTVCHKKRKTDVVGRQQLSTYVFCLFQHDAVHTSDWKHDIRTSINNISLTAYFKHPFMLQHTIVTSLHGHRMHNFHIFIQNTIEICTVPLNIISCCYKSILSSSESLLSLPSDKDSNYASATNQETVHKPGINLLVASLY